MKGNIRILVLSCLILVFVQCKDQSNFKIEGSFKIPENKVIVLNYLGTTDMTAVDSSKVDEQGSFKLNGYCELPSLYSLIINQDQLYLVIKPGDKLKLEIDNSIAGLNYYVTGSSDSRLVRELSTSQRRVLDIITDLSIEYEKSKQNPAKYEENRIYFDSLYDDILNKHRQATKEFIYRNPKSLACIFALYQNFGRTNTPLFDKFEDIEIFNFVDSNLTILYPRTPAVRALNKDVSETKDQIKYREYSGKLFEPGRKAPELSIDVLGGETIKLSELEGKPVLYFFFAVWNKKSAQEAIAINDLYLKYRYYGLKVIGVSFDTSEEKLQLFIDQNNIKFPIGCDYKYWDSENVTQFGVRFIPDVILLDKNHVVSKRNINSSELMLIFKEWRKNKLF